MDLEKFFGWGLIDNFCEWKGGWGFWILCNFSMWFKKFECFWEVYYFLIFFIFVYGYDLYVEIYKMYIVFGIYV